MFKVTAILNEMQCFSNAMVLIESALDRSLHNMAENSEIIPISSQRQGTEISPAANPTSKPAST